jgi:nitroimidazol reductase NimA-like FMN-containing flavoprotein (pyridoxamine 5'-phosphate oxidase superfamily)
MKLTKIEQEFLRYIRVARVATVDSGGIPHNVPVCPLFYKDKIYFATEKNAKKARNIQGNPNVTMVFDEYGEAWDFLRGIMIRGEARVVKRTEFRQLRKQIYDKYLRYESKAAIDEKDSVIVEINPDSKFAWGLG